MMLILVVIAFVGVLIGFFVPGTELLVIIPWPPVRPCGLNRTAF